jgi:hypothetical protein
MSEEHKIDELDISVSQPEHTQNQGEISPNLTGNSTNISSRSSGAEMMREKAKEELARNRNSINLNFHESFVEFTTTLEGCIERA